MLGHFNVLIDSALGLGLGLDSECGQRLSFAPPSSVSDRDVK